MKIGIIGANGFIGRHLCQKFLSANKEVIAFYNLNKNNIPLACKKIAIKAEYSESIDFLFVSIGNFMQSETQVVQQKIILEKLLQKLNFKHLIYISSADIYSETEKTIDVSAAISARNTYTKSKIEEEKIISKNNNYCILRPTYIYGSGMHATSLIPFWIKQAKKELKISVFGKGNRKQDYLHIEDFSNFCLKLIQNFQRNTTCIVASGNSISNLELANIIASQFESCKIESTEGEEGLSRIFELNNTFENYDWRPKTPILDGLKKFIQDENTYF
ncbi:MAG: NAD-dependent epimerase/dehydratase family protein [Flavobacteriia bacterium]|jgi:nucleoside-diphosphate-sugar epimerase